MTDQYEIHDEIIKKGKILLLFIQKTVAILFIFRKSKARPKESKVA